MKILFIGDIVGRPGREAALALMPILSHECGPFDAVIANAENAAGGKGVTRAIVNELFEWGVDVITTGNHVWAQREVFEFIDTVPNIIRPANFPKNTPGRGSIVATTNAGVEIGVINVAGQVYMENYENPFHTLDCILPTIRSQTKLVIVDFHAEATSEKIAMGWYADGKVSAIIGTHTHVQTADERVLPKGTAYITDVGMTGPHDSVIGMKKDIVLRRFLTMLPVRHQVADDDVLLCAVLVDLDEKTGKANSIQRIRRQFNKNAKHTSLSN